MSEAYEKGMKVRRQVLGDAYVNGTEGAKTGFDADFERFKTEKAWGAVWTRPHFTLRERSIVTLTTLAALGNWEEFALHARATANTGATPEDLLEAMMHVAVYAGVPRANHAVSILKRIYAERDA